MSEYFPVFSPTNIWRVISFPARFLWGIRRGVLVFVILLAVAHGAATFILGRKVEREIAAIKAKGQPVSFSDLEGPPLPEGENAAVIYEQVFEKTKGIDKRLKLKDPKSGKTVELNFFDVLDPEKRSKFPELMVEARSATDEFEEVMPMIEEASKRPECRFDLGWEKGPDMDFHSLVQSKTTARLLAVRAYLKATDGDIDEAVRSLELGFALSRLADDQPTIIGLLISSAHIDWTTDGLRESASAGKFTDEQAKSLYEALPKGDRSELASKALMSERVVCGFWAFKQESIYGPAHYNTPRYDDRPEPSFKWLRRNRVVGYLFRPFAYADELLYLNNTSKAVEDVKLPYRELKAKGLPEREDYVHGGKDDSLPWYAFTTRLFQRDLYVAIASSRDMGDANLNGDLLFLAAIAFKDRFGSYPASLSELRSRLEWEIPQDPFSGKDFGYRQEGDGFTLWSIGPDLVDEGGRLKWGRHEGIDGRSGDIIWRLEK